MESTWIILTISLVVITCWSISHCMKTSRIQTYITDRGGKVMACRWQRRTRGAPGPLGQPHYQVRYVDSVGRLHEAACSVRTFSSVYFTHDEIVGNHGTPIQFVGDPDAAPENSTSQAHSQLRVADLEREVRRLRKRLREDDTGPPSGEG